MKLISHTSRKVNVRFDPTEHNIYVIEHNNCKINVHEVYGDYYVEKTGPNHELIHDVCPTDILQFIKSFDIEEVNVK